MPNNAAMSAAPGSINQNETCICTTSGTPSTWKRLTSPSHWNGCHAAFHNGWTWPEAKIPYEYAPMAKNAAYPRSRRPAKPTTMLRPSARMANEPALAAASTSPPSRRPTGAPGAPGAARRSLRRRAWARRRPCASGLLRRGQAEETRRPQDEHDDQDGKDDDVGPAHGEHLPSHRLDETDHEPPDHRAGDVTDAAEHRRGTRAQAGRVPDDEARVIVVQAEDQAGRSRERGADEECQHDDVVDLDAHHPGGFLVLSGRAHRLAELGPPDEDVQRPHEHERHPPQEHLAEPEHGPADAPCHGGHGVRVVERRGAHGQQDDVVQDVRDADRGDHRRGPAHVTHRPERDALDHDPEHAADQHRAGERQRQRVHQRHPGQDAGLPGQTDPLEHEHRDERADHEDVEVREVDQLDDAVHHGEPERQQRVHRPEAQAVDDLLEENVAQVHRRRLSNGGAGLVPPAPPPDLTAAYSCGATPIYLNWCRMSSSLYSGLWWTWNTLTTRLLMSPFWSNSTMPWSVCRCVVWMASRTLCRSTGLPLAAARLIASMITSAASYAVIE